MNKQHITWSLINFVSLNPKLYDTYSSGEPVFDFVQKQKFGLDYYKYLGYKEKAISRMIRSNSGMNFQSWVCFWFVPMDEHYKLTSNDIITETARKLLGLEEYDCDWEVISEGVLHTIPHVVKYLNNLINK